MTIRPIDVTVPGRAAGLTATKLVAESWKQAVARAVAEEWAGGFVAEPCAIRLAFDLSAIDFHRTAVYNLLKATIDGLGSIVFRHAPAGQPGPWSTEDWWISELIAEKRNAVTPAMHLRLATRFPALETTDGCLADVEVDGPSPPWPGDSAGHARVLAWREALRSAVAAIAVGQTPADISVDLDFHVTELEMRRTDLDNLCVPAAQAVCYAIFGGRGRGERLLRLQARKTCVTSRDPSTRVRVFRAEA